MGILPACVSVYRECAWCLQRPEQGIWPSGIGVTDNCNLWVLAVKPGSSERAARVLTSWTVSPAPWFLLFYSLKLNKNKRANSGIKSLSSTFVYATLSPLVNVQHHKEICFTSNSSSLGPYKKVLLCETLFWELPRFELFSPLSFLFISWGVLANFWMLYQI